MPTVNQLVRKPRKISRDKSKSPALQRVTNNLKTKSYEKSSPFKRGVGNLDLQGVSDRKQGRSKYGAKKAK
jgi:ribosomal protein S12